MQTILPPSGNTIKILGKARSAEHGLRWMTYVLAQPVEGGVLVFHTLTRALLLLTPEEYAAPDNLPELRDGWFRVPQEIGDDIRSRGEVFTRSRRKIHDTLDAVQHVPRFPSGHGHVLHRRGRLGCGELCLCTHFTGFCTKLVEVIPGRTGNGRNLAHLGIEVGCGLHCGSAKTRYSGSHRQELLTDILHRRSNVLELFSGFIDLSKCRIGSSRLVL